MDKSKDAFVIDDKLGASENFNTYADVLEGMDAPLGAALRPHLASLATGQGINAATIWDALYASAAQTKPDPAASGAGANGTEDAT